MDVSNFNRVQLARLLDNDERAKFVLHLLEVDWPTALALIPVAVNAVGCASLSDEVLDILRRSLKSYDAALGSSDRQRLKAFITPLVDGVTNLLMSDPPKVEVIGEFQGLVVKELGEQCFVQVRQKVADYLMPLDTPIGMVWRSISRSESSV